ncbi:MAG: tRNA uridine-5-carboxymethylaminomethyl(34) synthesis GTPase MnmE [Candidatus Izimaplasma sp.]|nr:tRNA uridine-5-carboxymethylaminomethyl(34) synthesis GTPase MnmE [Candidatus Izimaplasma bacterium]
MNNETIVAISTAVGESAISIVRLSGDNAIALVNKVFDGPNLENVPGNTIHYGHLVDENQPIDEVMVSIFRNPKSFTTEDVVEINCHGGYFVASKVVELMLKNGAHPASPGEFTMRGFLHGRIDFTQAEAVMDVIHANSNLSLTLANKGLDGVVYELIQSLRQDLLQVIAQIEVNIDYPEYDDVEELTNQKILPEVTKLIGRFDGILERAEVGKIIREGIDTAIIGRPNVGKSSILNALLREDKAIVTEIQGTTRDIVEGTLNIGGIVLNLIDTAGIRESHDRVESIGIQKAKEVIQKAQLILYVLDNNQRLTYDDKQLLELTKNKKRIIIINKVDLDKALHHDFENSIEMSALHKEGLDDLEKAIKDMFVHGAINQDYAQIISNARHIAIINNAKKALKDALQSISDGMLIDMIEIDLKDAWSMLGEIIGETSSTALLDELFSNFCLGK